MVLHALKECVYYSLGVIASCGPSQIFGLVKGTIDLARWCQIRNKIRAFEKATLNLNEKKFSVITKDRVVRAFVQKHYESLEDAENDPHLKTRFEAKITKCQIKRKRKQKALYADLLALIPLVGAIFSWRVFNEKGFDSLRNSLGVEYGFNHLLESSRFARTRLYPLSGKPKQRTIEWTSGDYQITRTYIDVNRGTKTTQLDVLTIVPKKGKETDKTVVFFHGNAMTNDQAIRHWGQYYANQGYNLVVPTMGGYPGSNGVKTSEATTYQDVEAIRLHLEEKGVTDVAFHGFSIGGSLAFQAAAGKTHASGLKTLFVVADQTFDSAIGVGGNVIRAKPLSLIGRGIMRAAAPVGEKIWMPNGLEVRTDGLNNARKASLLKEREVPLVSIVSDEDRLMGGKVNLGHHLLKARYGHVKKEHLITVKGDHGVFFGTQLEAHRRLAELIHEFTSHVPDV